MRRTPPSSWPKRLIDGEGEAADLLRKVDRQPRQAPSEPAAWESTLRRLGRDSSHARLRVTLAGVAGAVVGAVLLYVALSRPSGGRGDAVSSRDHAGTGAKAETRSARTGAGATAPVAHVPPPSARPISPRSSTRVSPPSSPNGPDKAEASEGGGAATRDGVAPGVAGREAALRASAPATRGSEPSDAPRIQLGRAAVGLPAGRAELLGEAEVTLSRGGRASAFATAAAATVDLDAGEVELAVQKRAAETSHVFEVTAGAYRFTVLGTRFRVVRANGDVTLSVTEGRVAVSRGAERLAVVTAGGFWAGTASPRATRATAGGDARAAVAMKGTSSEVQRPAERTAAAEGPPPGPTTRSVSDLRGDPRADGRLPLGGAAGALAPPPFAPPVVPPSSAPASVTASPAVERARPVARAGAAAAQTAPSPSRGPRSQGCAVRTPGQPRLACLLDEGRGSDLAAEVALYEAARIYRDALGDTDHAIATLRELRRRFPGSALSSEAALSLAELLPKVGRYREALVESAAVLGAHPTAERADEIHLMRGDLLRGGLGDCRAALNEYAQVAEVTRSSIADPALFYGAVCLKNLGDRPAARRALERYLARAAPSHAAEAEHLLGELERDPRP